MSLRPFDNIISSDLFATVALTTAWTTSPATYVGGANQINVGIRYTKGSSYALNLAFDFAGTTSFWKQESKYGVSSNVAIHQPLFRKIIGTTPPLDIAVPVSNKWFRVRHQAVSAAGGAKLFIKYEKSFI